MSTFHSIARAGLPAFLFAALFAGAANANCLSKMPRSAARPVTSSALAAALSVKPPAAIQPADVSFPEPEPSIAGYWYVRFTSGGQLVDDGFDIWHSDGSEVLNDTTAPLAGAVCIGIWTRTDHFTYVLKHPTWLFDDAGANLVGIGVIRETVKLDPQGNSFTGSSTIDVYDMSGNLLDEQTADVSATRINALDDATAPAAPIPGLPAAILNR